MDKQGTIVSSVLPLLPLLQAVPLHIEVARNVLNDAISKLVLPQKLNSESSNQSVAVKITGKRKRSQRSSSSSPLPESPSKKRTLTINVLKDARPTTMVQSPREKADVASSVCQHRPFDLSSSSALMNHGFPDKCSPLPRPADTSTPLSPRNTFVLPKFSTPRKPPSDLPVHPFRQTPAHANGTLKLSNALVYGNPVPRSNTISPFQPEITPTAVRPPRLLRVHASISNSMRNKPMEPTSTSTTFRPMDRNVSDIVTSPTFSGQAISSISKALSPSSTAAPFLPSKMNRSPTGNPQDGPKTITQNEQTPRAYKPTLDTVTHVEMPPPNQTVLENRARAKGKVVPTTVALGNMKETAVS